VSTSLPAVAILAGGTATRLRPITQTIPKALVEVNAQPFIKHQLALLKRNGVERVVLCVGHLGDMIRDVIGDGRAEGLDVQYAFDGDTLLGTGGALKHALPLLGNTFFVLYGDSYLDCDYSAIYAAFVASNQPALMTVYRNANQWDKSNVIFREGQIIRYDKRQTVPEMQHIDYGLGILRREVFDPVPDGEPVDLATIYGRLVTQGQLAGYEVHERFYEIGSFSGLEETRTHLAGEQSKLSSQYVSSFLKETEQIAQSIDQKAIAAAIELLKPLMATDSLNRLFILGNGGSAANASHAVNDFRKIAHIETYTPTDNVSELTAWVNDVDWGATFVEWLKESKLRAGDILLVFSVGGGSATTSPNLVQAMTYAREHSARILAVASRDGGISKEIADVFILIPVVNSTRITPHAEAWQAVVWHLIVNALVA
jgi:N-acetyl-alpha-D-muramate 1-phosphate uridylyltransferase